MGKNPQAIVNCSLKEVSYARLLFCLLKKKNVEYKQQKKKNNKKKKKEKKSKLILSSQRIKQRIRTVEEKPVW